MRLRLFIVTILLMSPACFSAENDFRYWALCYHDVRDDVDADLDVDPMAVSTAHLLQHFEWLRTNGYHPIRLSDIDAAKTKGVPLPDKAILLTFDDGFSSFYHKIYPLLKLYQFPAVFALVTRWVDIPEDRVVDFGNMKKQGSDFLNWKQVKEMSDSDWVEIASHSHDLHRGVISNPQNNRQAGAVTRLYFEETKSYESDADYEERIYHDLKKSRDLIEAYTGASPTAIVWPYGRYNLTSKAIAKRLGMHHSLSLGEEPNQADQEDSVARYLVSLNPSLDRFMKHIKGSTVIEPVRVVHVDLDYIYDADIAQQERNLDRLLDRIKSMAVNTVYLQAFADPDGDGNADAVYFNTDDYPIKADLFNRVSWQLSTRANVTVFAWMPVTSFVVSDELYQQWSVYSAEPSVSSSTAVSRSISSPAATQYKRLSIFHPEAKRFIHSIYADLAKYSSFAGVLFHDDAYLSDFEDVSPAAIAYYRAHGFAEFELQAVRSQPDLLAKWSRLKTKALIDFTLALTGTVKTYRPAIKTARNMYALPIIQTQSEAWFSQELNLFLSSYDQTAVMAMPYMENATNPLRWLKALVEKVGDREKLDRMVFEIQSVDWRSQTPIDATTMVMQMRLLQRLGAVNFGYYPDNFLNNQPDLNEIKKGISVENYPYPRSITLGQMQDSKGEIQPL